MERWRLLDLGFSEPYIAQTFYEAVAEAVHRDLSPNTLILLQPGSPYACIGYHQDLENEIDLEFCRDAGLPIIRRSQGGGATYLDRDQVFYQIVSKGSGVVPRDVEEMFERLLSVTVETYRRLGVPAEFKPLNDVVVGGRKISGNGAGMHESASILVGNVILDLNYDLMARVLKVPDEKFRDKIAKSMREWVTTLRRELEEPPSVNKVKETYAVAFQEVLGVELMKAEPTNDEWGIFNEETKPRHTSREWLYMEAARAQEREGRAVKIAHDVKFVEADHKARKMIRVRAEVMGDEILDIQIRGDFFAIPKESIATLEEMLKGKKLEVRTLRETIDGFYKMMETQTPGIGARDFVEALMKMKEYL
ncbi:MAG: lipoate--protein ligase [Candidatus Bathyarchaeota archaeon]|nr:lipoate--protein ligase [Candidatus Bathyarchaeota archaeon]